MERTSKTRFKNLILNLLVALFKTKSLQESKTETKRFLIVSTTGLGDSLWATPALRALKERYPHSHVGLLTSELGAQVLKGLSLIDEFFVLKGSSFLSFLKLYPSLKKKKFDTILLFHASQRLAIPICALLNPKKFIATAGLNKGLDHLLTYAVEKKPVHEIERRLDIVKEVGAVNSQPFLELSISKDDQRYVENYLRELSLPPYLPLVGIHPGAKDRFKQWDPECYTELGKRLQGHLGCQIFVTGNFIEKHLVQSIAEKIPHAIPLYGRLSIHQIAALIQKMSIMITNDTGPMHLAFAVQTPTVALFSATDPKLCGPHLANHVKVIHKKPTCSPCLKKKCRQPFCLLQISPDEVFERALELYYKKENYERSPSAPPPSYLYR